MGSCDEPVVSDECAGALTQAIDCFVSSGEFSQSLFVCTESFTPAVDREDSVQY